MSWVGFSGLLGGVRCACGQRRGEGRNMSCDGLGDAVLHLEHVAHLGVVFSGK